MEFEYIDVQIPAAAAISSGPIFKSYLTYESRLFSFERLCHDTFPDHKIMSRAGFFFSGVHGLVVCFYCGVCVGDWSNSDSPWKEHQIHSSQCAFLILNEQYKDRVVCVNFLIF